VVGAVGDEVQQTLGWAEPEGQAPATLPFTTLGSRGCIVVPLLPIETLPLHAASKRTVMRAVLDDRHARRCGRENVLVMGSDLQKKGSAFRLSLT
jgi:hypothetical protein